MIVLSLKMLLALPYDVNLDFFSSTSGAVGVGASDARCLDILLGSSAAIVVLCMPCLSWIRIIKESAKNILM